VRPAILLFIIYFVLLKAHHTVTNQEIISSMSGRDILPSVKNRHEQRSVRERA
jgi:hypothetical protein